MRSYKMSKTKETVDNILIKYLVEAPRGTSLESIRVVAELLYEQENKTNTITDDIQLKISKIEEELKGVVVAINNINSARRLGG